MNFSVDFRYSIPAFNISLLTVNLQLGLPYTNVWIKWSSPWDKICLLIFLILFKRDSLGNLGSGEKSVIISVSLPQSHNGFRVSWKQCLNLWLRKWLRSRCNLIRSLIPYGLWILKNTIYTSLSYKVSQFLFKNWETSWVSGFTIKIVPFRYSKRKGWILEITVSCMICRIIIAMSVSQTLFKLGIELNRYDGEFSFNEQRTLINKEGI